MYKVFLVEDEIVARESIRDNLSWEKSDFLLAGEAADGEMALPLIEEIRPDILIADIKMPFLDGLALSRIVKKNMPWVKIVIISGYDEFSFAREAISIGVTEYLLKPISARDLLDSLARIAAQIETETRERENKENLSRCLKDTRQVMAERFLTDLVTGIVPSAESIEKAREFGIDLVGRNYIVAVISPEVPGTEDPRLRYSEYLKAENWILEMLKDNHDVVRFCKSLKEIVLIFKGEEAAALESQCFTICQSIKYEVERRTACALSINIGSVCERIQGIGESYAQAETASRFHYIFGRNRIVGIEDARRANLGGGIPSNDILLLDCGQISDALRGGEKEDALAALRSYLGRIRERGASAFFLGYAVINVVLAAARFVEELGGAAEKILPPLDRMDLSSGGEGEDEPASILAEVLQAAFEFREKCRRNKYADVIMRAKDYIVRNYDNSGISLNTIAAHVHVSPSHFSTIFSQETGQTVIDYLTQARMTQARAYLKSSSLRSSDIAYKVGYKDPHYFSYIFKRHCGCTPSEYRDGGVPVAQAARQEPGGPDSAG